MVYKMLWCNMQPIEQENIGANPLLFAISALVNYQWICPSKGQSNGKVSCLWTQVSRLGLQPTHCWSETPELDVTISFCFRWSLMPWQPCLKSTMPPHLALPCSTWILKPLINCWLHWMSAQSKFGPHFPFCYHWLYVPNNVAQVEL